MKRFAQLLLVLLTGLVLTESIAFASDEGAAMAACGGVLVFFIGLIVLNIILLVWVAKDAKSRGMDNPILWMILVFFTGLLGLIIYLLARTGGEMTKCQNCNNKRLIALAKCPHCGN